MSRDRAKAVVLGLAFVAGELRAADLDAPPVQPAGAVGLPAPRLLPAELRTDSWAPAGANDAPTVWLPARPRPQSALPMMPEPALVTAPPAVLPPLVPAALMPAPSRVDATLKVIGPRVEPRLVIAPPLPKFPERPAEPPTVPVPPPVQPRAAEQSVANDWRAVEPRSRPPVEANPSPRLSVLPETAPPEQPHSNTQAPLPVPKRVPDTAPTAPQPAPTAPQPAQNAACELPTAPLELMRPVGWNGIGKHGTFGSAPIRLSRDYPPLGDLVTPGSQFGTGTNRLQFQAEYLLWWLSAANYPVLATTTSAPGAVPTLAAGNGFLGDPATSVLLGDGPIGGRQRQGLRLRAGYWLDDSGNCGFDAGYFVLGNKTDTFEYASNGSGSPVITRPFFSPNLNPNTGQVVGETGEIVAFPNFSAGVLSVQTASSLWGADVNFRRACLRSCEYDAGWFAGFRFLSLSESVRITEYINSLPSNMMDPVGTQVVVVDQFQTRNRFYGAQLGGTVERNWNRYTLGVRGSLALGTTHQEVTIDGGQLRVRPGGTPMTYQGGLLAAGPNLGSFSENRFSVVPELMLNAGYWVTPRLKLYAGYNALFWSNVVRPGDAIDRVVDVTFVPNPPPGIAASGANRPQPQFQQSNLWVQGIQLGAEWRW